jgi:hypothetical protein
MKRRRMPEAATTDRPPRSAESASIAADAASARLDARDGGAHRFRTAGMAPFPRHAMARFVHQDRSIDTACHPRSDALMKTPRKEASAATENHDPCIEMNREICAECISPAAPPWLPFDQCLTWYDSRVLNVPTPGNDIASGLQFLLVYEHCMRLEGRKQGPLLFSTTLLPQEKLKLYHFERYRRGRSETSTVSVHTSFREYVSALHQNWGQTNTSKFTSDLDDTRTQADRHVGTGGLLSFIGVDAGISESSSTQRTHLSEVSVQTVAGEFDQKLRVASQAVDAERSVVISTFEERDTTDITQREIRNDNDCRAVTYFVRRVMEGLPPHDQAHRRLLAAGPAQGPRPEHAIPLGRRPRRG